MIQYFDKPKPIWTRNYTLLRLSFATKSLFFLSLWKLLAKEWCCSNTGIRSEDIEKKYRYKIQTSFESKKLQIPINLYIPNIKEQIGKKKYHAQVFRKKPLSRAEIKIKIINKTSSQCPPERLKIFSPRDC